MPPQLTRTERLREARYALSVLALGLVILVWVGATQAWHALALFLTVAATAALAPRRKRKERRARTAAAAQDKTQIRQAARTLCDAFSNPVFMVSGDGALLHANPAAQRVFGPARAGLPFLFKFRNPEISAMVVAALEEGRPATGTYIERQPTERWFSVSIDPVGISGAPSSTPARPDYFVISFQDRTEARLSETMRTDFVANASHELRTPLASLSGFIETLRGPARNDAAAREKFLGVMQEQSERMSRLVDDLLSLSRIEMRVHRQPTDIVDLGEVVGHVIDALQPLASEVGVELRTELPSARVCIHGQRDELVQVYENLVDNAIKYGRSGGLVEVSLVTSAEGSLPKRDLLHPVSVSVRDHGPGIAEEHLPRLTERFYRVDAEVSRSAKGTGLGLSIVKHILTRHKGRLEIASKPGQGARFTTNFAQAALVKDQ